MCKYLCKTVETCCFTARDNVIPWYAVYIIALATLWENRVIIKYSLYVDVGVVLYSSLLHAAHYGRAKVKCTIQNKVYFPSGYYGNENKKPVAPKSWGKYHDRTQVYRNLFNAFRG